MLAIWSAVFSYVPSYEYNTAFSWPHLNFGYEQVRAPPRAGLDVVLVVG